MNKNEFDIPFKCSKRQGTSVGKIDGIDCRDSPIKHVLKHGCLLSPETTVILRGQDNLWPGNYKVKMEVKDQQGKSCADFQVMEVIVCACHGTTKTCLPRSSKITSLGFSGVLLLLLGLLLLLREYGVLLTPVLILFSSYLKGNCNFPL